MLFRRKKTAVEPELTREDMEELVDENIQFAEKYASEGNVSGMEMSMEIAMKYGQKIGRSFDSKMIEKIKLMGYELGEKSLREKALEFQKQGKAKEAQNALQLASIYGNEARLLRYIM
jgi:hypothetical protein